MTELIATTIYYYLWYVLSAGHDYVWNIAKNKKYHQNKLET